MRSFKRSASATIEARRPFTDLIATVTQFGAQTRQTQQDFQRQVLSLATPREELFAQWDGELQAWTSLDSVRGMEHVGTEILKTMGCSTMEEARNAFRNPWNAGPRIDTILRNADSIAFLISEMGRQLDPVPALHSV